ncbi:MAG: class I SAM-dependent rRNA methyltransferase, partial [Phycisphaerae bacterium]
PDARPGDCVSVYDRKGQRFGSALYNPHSNIALRMISFSDEPISDEFWQRTIRRAVDLRVSILNLPAATEAFRVVHAEGDELSGLVVDQYRDVLSISIYSLGMWRLADTLLPMLLESTGVGHYVVRADKVVGQREGFAPESYSSPRAPKTIDIREHGIRFRVPMDIGHKTGFFCDQRDNRLRFSGMVSGADVLDLCCFSGGFGVYAKVRGGARSVKCVDLDEKAVAVARQNANLNQARVDVLQSDVFTYMRQMKINEAQYGAVVLDPPKLIFGKQEDEGGLFKYRDLNKLACGLVKPGGVLLSCSCSGALSREEFVHLVTAAARQIHRRYQILDVTGAAMDHPVHANCPESAYLKAVWLRLY